MKLFKVANNLRKSANRNAKLSSMCRVEDNDSCVAICRFSQVVFVTSNNFTHNLFFLFLIVLGALVNKSAYV